MSVTLDARSESTLQHFARRRRWLLMLRGVLSVVAIMGLWVLLVAMIDWIWIVPEMTRWLLGACGYVVAAIAFYLLYLRPAMRGDDLRDLARRMETADPQLRERLLNAVELADETGLSPRDADGEFSENPTWRGSDTFRQHF
ncbi:MAG: hypothetical protein AAFP69_23835, partial [Planctomycetota bacterium]